MAQPIAAEDVAVIDSTLAYGQCMSSPGNKFAVRNAPDIEVRPLTFNLQA